MELTRNELAELLGVSPATLRKYEDYFSAWVKTPKGVKGQREAKRYIEEDVKLFSVIVAMRSERIGLDDIRDQLDERLATTTSEVIPAAPPVQEDSEARALVANAEQRLARAVGMLEATEREVAKLTQQNEELQKQLDDLRERAVRAETERDMLKNPPSWWRRMFGGGDS